VSVETASDLREDLSHSAVTCFYFSDLPGERIARVSVLREFDINRACAKRQENKTGPRITADGDSSTPELPSSRTSRYHSCDISALPLPRQSEGVAVCNSPLPQRAAIPFPPTSSSTISVATQQPLATSRKPQNWRPPLLRRSFQEERLPR
jgi:hypothetical protein